MNDKIKHPFHVPNDFFEEFKTEILGEIELQIDSTRQSDYKKIILVTLKYAAIVVFAFLFGRYSTDLNHKKSELPNVETVFNQVSEDEIVAFIIEDELFEKQ